MNQSRLAGVITAVVVGVALLASIAKSKGWRSSDVTSSFKPREKTPEDTIYAMLDAARVADPQAYLDCYTGQMKDELSQTVKESGGPKFVSYLKTSNAAVQGVALSPPQPVTDGLVKVRVEYIYRDRNEVQFVYLAKLRSAWKISKVDGAERVKTLVPFGTAISD